MTHWSSRYIGLPYHPCGRTHAGIDCWGIPFLVFPIEKGIRLPSLDYTHEGPPSEIAGVIADTSGSFPWHEVPLTTVREFDVLTFRRGRYEQHCGVVAGGNLMLHICQGAESHLASYTEMPWSGRLVKVYRHAELMA